MRALLLSVLLILAGCGDQGDDLGAQAVETNHGYGWHYDDESETTGLRVRYSELGGFTIEEYDVEYLYTIGCVGVDAPGPLLIQSAEPVGARVWARDLLHRYRDDRGLCEPRQPLGDGPNRAA